LNIGIQNGKDTGVSLDLVTHKCGQSRANRAIEFTDNDLGFGAKVPLVAFNQSFSRAHANSICVLAHDQFLPLGEINPYLSLV
jgi:hypothetical protein